MKNKLLIWGVFATLLLFCVPVTALANDATPGVAYRGHIQDIGNYPTDENTWIQGPEELGTEGHSLRLEGVQIKLTGAIPAGAHIKYNVHVQDIGWLYSETDTSSWAQDGAFAGTTARSLRIEAVRIILTDADGNALPGYSVAYRGHIQDIGNFPTDENTWLKDGDRLGTVGESLRLEALEVKIVSNPTDLTVYNALLETISKSVETDYTATSWTALQKALIANAVTADTDQLDVNQATAAIQTAFDGLVKKATAVVYDTAGTYGPETGTQVIDGDVIVKADGITLRNLQINGNLYIGAEQVAEKAEASSAATTNVDQITQETTGSITTELEKIYIAYFTRMSAGTGVGISGSPSQAFSFSLPGGTQFTVTTPGGGVGTGAPMQITAGGSGGSSSGSSGGSAGGVSVGGAIGSLSLLTPGTQLSLAPGCQVQQLSVLMEAPNCGVITSPTAVIQKAVIQGTGAAFSGPGAIQHADIQANGASFATRPGAFTVAPGVTTPPSMPAPPDSGGGYTPPEPVSVESVTLNTNALDVGMTKTAQLIATIAPDNATDQTVTWSSSNDAIATVDNTGKVTGIKEGGPVIITATSANDKTASCAVTVKDLNLAITGLTVPFHGDKPDAAIDATYQYTGAVTWREQGASADLQTTDTFDGAKTYVATITLSLLAPYTVADIPANCFTVAGATTTNDANTAVVTAVFAPYDQYRFDNAGVITAYSGPGGELVIPDIFKFTSDSDAITVTGIGDNAFNNRGLTRVTLPGGIQVGDHAFAKDLITSITIGNNATISNVADTMGVYGSAFYAYYVNADTSKPAKIAGHYFYESGAWQIDNGLSFVGATITAFDKTKGPYVFIPKTGAGTDITAIADGNENKLTGVFSDGGLKTLIFASDSQVKTIGSLAFTKNMLVSISLPDTVETIGFAAFYNNQQLKNVTLSSGLKTIDDSAFQSCSLDTLTLPNNLETIGVSAFAENKLAGTLTIPASVTCINDDAFRNNTITSLVIEKPADTLTIQASAFKAGSDERNLITRITIPAEVTISDDVATMGFYGANFKAAYTAGGAGIYNYDSGTATWVKETIPVGVTCPSVGVTPVTTIAVDDRFEGNVVWTETASKASVAETFVGGKAYTATITLTPKGGYSFPAGIAFSVDGATINLPIIFADGKATIVADFPLLEYDITAAGVITRYYGLGGDVTIPDKVIGTVVTGIGKELFIYKSLTGISIPATVTIIEEGAFHDCSKLSTVTYRGTSQLKTLEKDAFANCALTSITLPDQLQVIGEYAFNGNKSNSLTIPGSVTLIGDSAFSDIGLSNLLIMDGNSLSIVEHAFYNNPLTSITLPDNVAIDTNSNTMGKNDAGFITAYTVGGTGTYTYNANTSPNWIK